MIKCIACQTKTKDYVQEICDPCWDEIRTQWGFEDIYIALYNANAAYEAVCLKLAEADAEIITLRKATYKDSHIKFDSFSKRGKRGQK